MNLKRTLLVGGTAVLLVASMSACGAKAQEPFKDAPRSGVVNNDPADIVQMPDGFSNLAGKCDHGNRVYTAYKGDSNRAAGFGFHDPNCPQPGGK